MKLADLHQQITLSTQIDANILDIQAASETPAAWDQWKRHREVYGWWSQPAINEGARELDRLSNLVKA